MRRQKSLPLFKKYNKARSQVVDTNEFAAIDACTRFYSKLEPKMRDLLHPSRHSSVQKFLGKSQTGPTYDCEEMNFALFLKKYSPDLTNYLRETVHAMAESYQEIADLKSQRESTMKSSFFDPTEISTNGELVNIYNLRTDVEEKLNALNSANRIREKNGDSRTMKLRNDAFQAHVDAKEKLQKALKEFLEDEPRRIHMLLTAVQIQAEYQKKMTEVLIKLVSEISTIQQRANDSTSLGNTAGAMEGEVYDYPQPKFGFSTTAANMPQTSRGRCQALYDFTGENDDNLSLKEGEIVTIIKQEGDQWYYGEKNGRKGFFPIAFVKLIPS